MPQGSAEARNEKALFYTKLGVSSLSELARAFALEHERPETVTVGKSSDRAEAWTDRAAPGSH